MRCMDRLADGTGPEDGVVGSRGGGYAHDEMDWLWASLAHSKYLAQVAGLSAA